MRMAICTMPGCQTSAGCKCNPPVYLAPFAPSPAEEWYGKELEALNTEIEHLRTENEELKAALREDAERMKADQDAIDVLRLSLSEARATGRREGLSEALRAADALRDEQRKFQTHASANGFKSEARDHESMKFAAVHLSSAIRAAMEKAE